ncbi:MAG: hypothetical protein VKI42_09535, partial [Synechococcaceae cyanobacterium]|nr:hypothetical protein [Synechococcaceae cyanobacterium]
KSFAYTPRDLTILLSTNADINASTKYQGSLDLSKIDQQAKGGSIFLGSSGQTLTISGAGTITAETKGSGKGGDINLSGTTISIKGDPLLGDLKVTAQTSATGEGGTIRVNADSLALTGAKTKLDTLATSAGNAGKIFLNAPDPKFNQTYKDSFAFSPRNLDINLSGGSEINASTNFVPSGGGIGGSIFLGSSGQTLTISGAGTITAETKGSGKGGDINLSGTKIFIGGGANLTAKTTASGHGGVIRVNADSLDLSGAKTQLNTLADKGSSGDAGLIFLKANSINLNQSSITAETQTTGLGGHISVDTSSLNLFGGSKLTTQAFNIGKAGEILLNAANPRSLAINFTGQSTINASTSQQASGGGKGGDILIGTGSTSSLSVSGPGSITAETKGSGNGGVLDLKATTITLSNGAKATTETSGSGKGGDIALTASTINLDTASRIDAKAGRTLDQIKINDSSEHIYTIPPNNGVTGDGGFISLRANTITLDNASVITAETQTTGQGGKLLVDTGVLNLYGNSRLITQAFNIGKAGEILLNAANPRSLAINFTGQSTMNASTSQQASGGGKGGDILIGSTTTPTLQISGSGAITAETKGWGDGGLLYLGANTISLNNGSIATTQTSGSGRGGRVQVQGNTITLDGGSRISAQSGQYSNDGTPGPLTPSGPAGSISIIASGPNSLHLFNGSSITAASNSSNPFRDPSDLGDISIRTPHLDMKSGSSISAKTDGAAQGGTINLEADRVDLDGSSKITAAGKGAGQAGNLNLFIRNNLNLSSGSEINASTMASSSLKGGANINLWVGGDLLLSGNSSIKAAALGFANGGNIFLRLPNGFLRAEFPVRGRGNDILATAEYGSGGLIDVRALGVFGFNFNTSDQFISEASTRAVSGRNGVVAIYTPYLDPDQGIVPIEQPLDPSNSLDQSCSPRAEQSSFQTCGRGGVPALPGDSPGRRPLLDDLGPPPGTPSVTPLPAIRSSLR